MQDHDMESYDDNKMIIKSSYGDHEMIAQFKVVH
jgi:hypothetical protein